jgi:hypothetical protein
MFNALCFAVALAASSIQWGWQPLPQGGNEYIVQVEPQLADLETFRKQGYFSEIPPQLRDIREIHIVVGSNPLPHQDEIPVAPAKLPSGVTASPLLPGQPQARSADGAKQAPVGIAAAPAATKPGNIRLTDHHEPIGSHAQQSDLAIGANGDTNAMPEHVAAAGKSEAASEQIAAAKVDRSKLNVPGETAADSTNQVADAPPASRPWMTLLLVAAGLIVSLSGNVFLGWVHWGTRNQYRALVSQLRQRKGPEAA